MASAPLIAPGGPAILDLTGYAGQVVSLNFDLLRSSDLTDTVTFYKVLDTQGSVSLGGSTFKPGDPGYKQAASASVNRLTSGGQPVSLSTPNNNQPTRVSFDVSGGSLWAPLANISPSGQTFYDWSVENPENFDNIRNTGNTSFSVEDLPGGGDRDFNDIAVSVTSSGSRPDPSPPSPGKPVQASYCSLSDARALEGDPAKVVITRSGNLSQAQHLRLVSLGGTAMLGKDYDKVDDAITFEPGQTKYVSLVPTKADSLYEPSEFITLQLSADSSGSGTPPVVINRQIGYVTILDGDDDNGYNSGPGYPGFGPNSYTRPSVVISGGVEASGTSKINIPSRDSVYYGASPLGPVVYAPSPYFAPAYVASGYYPAAYSYPSYLPGPFASVAPEIIAISGGVQASQSSTVTIGADTIAPGVNVGATTQPAAPFAPAIGLPVVFANPASGDRADIQHFANFSPYSFGIAVPFGYAPLASSALVPGQFGAVLLSPDQMAAALAVRKPGT